MDNDVKTKNNEEIAHFLNASDRMIKGIDILRKKNRPLLNGHRYLTDDELSACCISTGARYRIIAIWGESPLSS